MIFVDLYLLIAMIMPPQHQILETMDSMKAAMKPLNLIQTAFYQHFDQIKYRLLWNGQVINLEHVLNETFGQSIGTIYITDAESIEQTYIFNQIEINEPTYLFNNSEGAAETYLFNSAEVAEFDFIINIPASVAFNEFVLRQEVNRYKLAGKRFSINIV